LSTQSKTGRKLVPPPPPSAGALELLPGLEAERRALAQRGVAGQQGDAGADLGLEGVDLVDELLHLARP
jgi:hypothetical protein